MLLEKRQILVISFLIEGILVSIFAIWVMLRGLEFPFYPQNRSLVQGVVLSFPLFALNYAFFGPPAERVRLFRGCVQFKRHVVKPLADRLDTLSALLVAALAGLGEELFFRGVVQHEFGLLAASLAFAILHFGPAIRSYYLVASLYLVFGFYFGFLMYLTQDIWVPIITHVVYDFGALLYLKHLYRIDHPMQL